MCSSSGMSRLRLREGSASKSRLRGRSDKAFIILNRAGIALVPRGSAVCRESLDSARPRSRKRLASTAAESFQVATASLKALADRNAANVLPIIREIQRTGAVSLHQIADALNARGISTPPGGQWYAKSVSNVLARAWGVPSAAWKRTRRGRSLAFKLFNALSSSSASAAAWAPRPPNLARCTERWFVS
jgi:hypothetical protein